MILDTSVFYDSLVAGPRSRAARDLLSTVDLWSAPDLIEIEIASALTRAVRRGEIDARTARLSFSDARDLMPEIVSSSPLIDRALELSLTLNHPASDCVFLALAELHNETLATSDAKFARKLTETPYLHLVKLIEP